MTSCRVHACHSRPSANCSFGHLPLYVTHCRHCLAVRSTQHFYSVHLLDSIIGQKVIRQTKGFIVGCREHSVNSKFIDANRENFNLAKKNTHTSAIFVCFRNRYSYTVRLTEYGFRLENPDFGNSASGSPNFSM